MRKIRIFGVKLIQSEFLLIFSQMLLVMGNDDDSSFLNDPDNFPNYPDNFPDYQSPKTNNGYLYKDLPKPLLLIPDQLNLEFLNESEPRNFYYLMTSFDVSSSYALSITIIPCQTNNLSWIIRYRNESNTGKLDNPIYPEEVIKEYNENSTRTFNLPFAEPGLYRIEVTVLDRNSIVQIYTTLSPRGPELFQLQNKERTLRFRKKEQKNKFNIRWSLSKIDPHLIKYVIVINTQKFYKSLCEAQIDYFQRTPNNLPESFREIHAELTKENPLVLQNVQNSSSFTYRYPVLGKRYFVNVFAINVTELSVLYASGSILYEKSKPRGLKDGKPARENIKANNGFVAFRYKVSKHIIPPGLQNELWLYVMTCGGVGLVNMEIRHQKKVVISKRRITNGYGKFIVKNPIQGDRYVIKISAISPEELSYFRHVEVMATIRPKLYPLPDLPPELKIEEYGNLEDCDSMTIGWLPVPDNNAITITYCVYVKEYDPNFRRRAHHRPYARIMKPDQCEVDSQIRNFKQKFILAQCKQYSPTNSTTRPVIIQKLTNLKSNHDYVLQITARKPGRRSLSYDLRILHKNHITCS